MNGVMETAIDNGGANIQNEKSTDNSMHLEDKSNNKLNNSNVKNDELTSEKQSYSIMPSDMIHPQSPTGGKETKLSKSLQYVREEKDIADGKTGHNSAPELPEKKSSDEGLPAPTLTNSEKKQSQPASPSLPKHNSSAKTTTYVEPQLALISKPDTTLLARCPHAVSTNSCSPPLQTANDRELQNNIEEEKVAIMNLPNSDYSQNFSKTSDCNVKPVKIEMADDEGNQVLVSENEEKTKQKIKEETHLAVTAYSQELEEIQHQEHTAENTVKDVKGGEKGVSTAVIASTELSSRSLMLSTSDSTSTTTTQAEALTMASVAITTTTTTTAIANTNAVAPPTEQQQLSTPLPIPLLNTSDTEKISETMANKSMTYRKRKSAGKSGKQESLSDEYTSLKRRKINVAGAPKMPLTGKYFSKMMKFVYIDESV